MLHILVCILKILGILLASVLGILLLLVLLVMFVPIRYRAELVLTEEGQKGDVRVSWLLHGFGIRLRYLEGALSLRARLFWIVSLKLFPAKEKKPKKARKQKKEKQKKQKKQKAEEPRESPQTAWDAVLELPDEGREEMMPAIPALPEPAGGTAEVTEGAGEDETPKRSVVRRLWELLLYILQTPIRMYRKLCGFFRNLKYTFHRIYGNINDIRENVNYYMEILKKDETKNAFSLCREQIFRLLAHLLPRKVKGSFRAGTGDPALTGQLYGLYCALCGVHRYQVKVTPDFDQRVMEGRVWLRGHIRVVHILVLGLRILFDKNVRYLIKQWRQS